MNKQPKQPRSEYRPLPAPSGASGNTNLRLASIDGRLLEETAEEMANCFSLASLEAVDQPLIYVNPAFCAMTGYSQQEIKGRNARFLQGSLSSPAAKAAIRAAIDARQAIFQDIINYHKNGTPFWNRMILLPIMIEGGGLHYIGLQNDVTAVKYQQGFTFSDSSPSFIAQLELKDTMVNPLTVLLLHRKLLNDTDDGELRQRVRARINEALERLIETILHADGHPSSAASLK